MDRTEERGTPDSCLKHRGLRLHFISRKNCGRSTGRTRRPFDTPTTWRTFEESFTIFVTILVLPTHSMPQATVPRKSWRGNFSRLDQPASCIPVCDTRAVYAWHASVRRSSLTFGREGSCRSNLRTARLQRSSVCCNEIR